MEKPADINENDAKKAAGKLPTLNRYNVRTLDGSQASGFGHSPRSDASSPDHIRNGMTHSASQQSFYRG